MNKVRPAHGRARKRRLLATLCVALVITVAPSAFAEDSHGAEPAAPAHGEPASGGHGGGHGPLVFGISHTAGLGPDGMLTGTDGMALTYASEEAATAEMERRIKADIAAGNLQASNDYTLLPLARDADHGKLDLFKIHPGTAYWLLITFTIFFMMLKKLAWPKILEGLEARERHIVESVQAAERANTEAAALLAQYEAKLAQARDEALGVIEEGKRDAVKVKDDIVKQGWKDAEDIKERARREMEMAASAVVKDIYQQMAVLSTEIASRIIERELSPTEHQRLVDEAISKYSES